MGYHADFSTLDISYLEKRLGGVELIPSHQALLEGLSEKVRALKKAGVATMADLFAALKGAKGPAGLSATTGIGVPYLELLRRAIEGFRPKPQALASFPLVDAVLVASLAALGIHDSRALYEASREKKGRAALAKKAGVPIAALVELALLSDLCRIQWVSPAYARLLYEAGYTLPSAVAIAKPDELCLEVKKANGRLKLTKVDIGVKDSARLVALAQFIEEEREA